MIDWPDIKPDIPFDPHGWFEECNMEMLNRFLGEQTQCVIELGSWLGKSTRYILKTAPNAKVFAVDTWRGSKEFEKLPDVKNKIEDSLKIFMSNCWQFKDRLKIIQETTIDGLVECYLRSARPNLVYIDASHEYEDVKNDIDLVRVLFPKAQIVGDDFNFPGVRRALSKTGREIDVIDNCWAFR